MSSKLKDKESKSLLENKVFHAAVIVSIILLSSAVFVSQTDRIFGKAATGTPITGTIVLFDQGGGDGIKSFFSKIYLPRASCIAYANYCFGDGTLSSYCRSKRIFSPGGDNQFVVELKGPGTELGKSSCHTGDSSPVYSNNYTKKMDYSYIYVSCISGHSKYTSSSAKVTLEGGDVILYSYGGGSDSESVLGPVGSVFTEECSGGSYNTYSKATVVEYDGELGGPLGHLDVTYVCP
ncbi:MAG: hypothetical protein DRN71_05565 [Candidatus Nanohalarchaeota archaeon]|nr:MAG: hypothetical protein DRN71_05565 [Candidatus Nanohaloarchaeota archaeon]